MTDETAGTTEQKRLQKRVRFLAAASIAVALVVMAIKFLAWRITGSVALYSDALESIVNVLAAAVAWYAVPYSHKPPDDTHPFGHHKAEYFSAVAEGVLIVAAAAMIILEAMTSILSEQRAIGQAEAGLAINLFAAAINGFWAWLLLKTGREARSPALVADARHIFSDVLTSVGVMVGLVLALATGWLILDPLLALIVAVNILYQGSMVIAESMQGLMDHALEPEEQDSISQAIEANMAGALEFHDLKTRRAGSARFVEFHLVVSSAMTVSDAHVICDRIEDALRKQFAGTRTTIHVEPEHKAKH